MAVVISFFFHFLCVPFFYVKLELLSLPWLFKLPPYAYYWRAHIYQENKSVPVKTGVDHQDTCVGVVFTPINYLWTHTELVYRDYHYRDKRLNKLQIVRCRQIPRNTPDKTVLTKWNLRAHRHLRRLWSAWRRKLLLLFLLPLLPAWRYVLCKISRPI